MATVLISSIAILTWIFLILYLRQDAERQKGKPFTVVRALIFGGAMLLAWCFTVLGTGVAYYFDFNQSFDTSEIIKFCGALCALGGFMIVLAVAGAALKK